MKPIDIINADTSLTKKNKKIFTRVFGILEDFLPKDASSPWPKNVRIRENSGYLSVMLVAFDGTIGVSTWHGMAYRLLLFSIFHGWYACMKPSQEAVYDAIANNNYLLETETRNVKELEEILYRYGYRIWVHIKLGNKFYDILSQDILKMLSLAKKLKSKEIELIKVDSINYLGGTHTLLTFSVGIGIYVHILSNTPNE